MKEIFINVDSYNSEGITTIQGNNNAEVYKICISKSKVRLSLVGKTVKLGYVMAGTTKGDIIEDLNITNAKQGEITLPITNKISKKDGIYTCELAIYGADEFLEYTATFGLTVQANIFTKIAGEIADTKDLTYIESILEEAKTVSRDLKTNIPVATNLNSSLESNISDARNINTTLADTTEKSKVAATDAIEKKSQLEKSITKAKEFIDGLDGSQDIPGMRMELTELQNGLKSNQALAYQGSSITANDTLEGRTEGMRISGRTLKNEFDLRSVSPNSQVTVSNGIVSWTTGASNNILSYKTMKLEDKQKYTLICNVYENTLTPMVGNSFRLIRGENYGSAVYLPAGFTKGIFKTTFTVDSSQATQWQGEVSNFFTTGTEGKIKFSLMIIKGDVNSIPEYFEGLKSFGESEQEGDKYKISILSHGKNLVNDTNFEDNTLYYMDTGKKQSDSSYKAFSLKVIPNKNYYFTINSTGINQIALYKNGVWKSGFYNNKSKLINGDYDEIKISVVKEGFINVQLEEGTTATSYETYKCDRKDILIKEPLRGFNENTCDVMYEDNGQVKINRNIDTYTFTGDEGWTLGTQSSGWGEFDDTLVFYLDPFKAKTNTRFICDKFAYKNVVNINEVGIYNNVWGNKPHPVIRIKKSELSTPDLEGFKSWLKTNPTTMIYQLAEPTIEIVENCVDIDLDTYQEKTYFNILNSLPGTLDFKVPSNIGSVVQNMAKEVNNIWDVINNLLVPSIVKANGNLAMLKLNNNLN
ncbi:phage baseplate upper protein [Clostridium perfringens]|uniref:BppU family phage baseplate upper protein n=1 Tax=Clostridium perfringens TaxID=1502 RepID=UPI001CD0305D|nr:BppU family phage baseplate upper protein [Clostridium perfringens]UBK99683.1 phage baseplate upper protein [Clostridium perfringens]